MSKGCGNDRQIKVRAEPRPPDPESAIRDAGILAVRQQLPRIGARFFRAELDLVGLQARLSDSPDRSAMEEDEIPYDLGTELQAILECILADLSCARRGLEEAARVTPSALEKRWQGRQVTEDGAASPAKLRRSPASLS